ncbi:MAG: hypothetical protein K6E21_04600 [Bacilli bacterium]|nr:hypothetical protein [Bacilli bacterium]
MHIKKLISLSLLSFAFIACSNKQKLLTNNKPLTDIPFNLNIGTEGFNPPNASLFKNEEQFNAFLKDETIFTNEPSEEFNNINAKYDASYFINNDLIAVIEWATSSNYYGYSLNKIYKEDNFWAISIKALSKSENVDCAMGAYFCYYFEVEKDPNMVDVKLTW